MKTIRVLRGSRGSTLFFGACTERGGAGTRFFLATDPYGTSARRRSSD
jgi:hypothetical protein